jgi:diphthine-ammonia ligase
MELAKAMKNNELAPESDWNAHIDNLKTKLTSKAELKNALVNAVKKRIPNKKFGIMFSGGVDSSLIAFLCKQAGADFVCYSVGIENSTDLIQAKDAAKQMGLKLVAKEYTLDEAEDIIKKVVALVGTDPVKVGVGAVVYACMQLAKKDKINTLFSGLGSEEIFAGYERHKVEDINAECWSGLKAMYDRDFTRDAAIAKEFNVKVLTPFLDQDLIKSAMSIDGKEKIKDNIKKYILRQTVEGLGLPKDIAWKKKMAAQYGSKFDRAILRLAHKKGLKYKKEYLCSLIKLGTLYSSGKDSTYALYLMQKQGYRVECLITMKSINPDSYMFHTPNIDMAKYQAEALQIPLLEFETEGKENAELKDLENAIKKAKDKYNIKGIITGALYSEYQCSRITKICEKLNLKVFSPLWHMDQEQELRDILNAGFKIILTAVAAEGLDKNWLGKELKQEDVDKLVKLNQKYKINIAGEGGEYESLVLAGPNFSKRLEIRKSDIKEESKNTAKLEIKEIRLI